MNNIKHQAITEKIINSFYTVYNILGYGFLEKVYENAMLIELRKAGLDVVPQAPIKVFYNDQIVGEYFADLIVGNSVIVELKTTAKLSVEHEAQLLNYLKATKHEVELLLNYGPKPELKRKVYDNTMKGNLSWV